MNFWYIRKQLKCQPCHILIQLIKVILPQLVKPETCISVIRAVLAYAEGLSHNKPQNRMNNATTAYYRLNKVWRSTSLTHHLKFKLYWSNVLSVLLYGCETWRLTREDLARLEVFHMSCCRKILKFCWWTKTFHDEVFRRSKQRAIIEMIEDRRWRYLGHSLCCKDSIPNTSLSWAPEGIRHRGRPKEIWRRTALKQLQGFNIKSWTEASEIAKDWDRWRDYEKMILTQYSTRNSAP